MKVRVYKNLHRNRFSIIAMEGPDKGKVVGHAADVLLMDADFRVSEAGRQRVIREGRKNVHAFVEGELASVIGFDSYEGRACFPTVSTYSASMWDATRNISSPFSYNPYKAGYFADASGRKMLTAHEVILSTHHAPVAHGGLRAKGDAQ